MVRVESLQSLMPEDVRMLSIDEGQITAILRDGRKVVFDFGTPEDLGKALELWAKLPADRRTGSWSGAKLKTDKIKQRFQEFPGLFVLRSNRNFWLGELDEHKGPKLADRL